MTGVTLLRISARLAAITSALVCAATPLAIAPSATADPCSDVKVVFARGTDDAPGLGRPGQAFADALSGLIGGRSLTTYGVNYPASYDFLAAADGAADAANYISALTQQCPSTRIVLGGYSQGAAVVDMLAGVPPLGNKSATSGRAPRCLRVSFLPSPRWRCSATPRRNSVIRSHRRFSAAGPSICARTATRFVLAAGTRSPTAIT